MGCGLCVPARVHCGRLQAPTPRLADSPESTDCPRPLAQDDDRHRAGHPVRARRPDDAGQHRQLVRDCQSGRRPRAGSHPGVRRGPLSGVDLWRQRVGPNPPLVTHPGRRAKKHGAMQLGVTSQNGFLLGIWWGAAQSTLVPANLTTLPRFSVSSASNELSEVSRRACERTCRRCRRGRP
jgi:hypothetical protein